MCTLQSFLSCLYNPSKTHVRQHQQHITQLLPIILATQTCPPKVTKPTPHKSDSIFSDASCFSSSSNQILPAVYMETTKPSTTRPIKMLFLLHLHHHKSKSIQKPIPPNHLMHWFLLLVLQAQSHWKFLEFRCNSNKKVWVDNCYWKYVVNFSHHFPLTHFASFSLFILLAPCMSLSFLIFQFLFHSLVA